jgi:hypothetical protein
MIRKMLAAFFAGAVLTGVSAFLWTHRATPQPEPVLPPPAQVAQQPVAQQPPVAEAPKPEPPPAPAPVQKPTQQKPPKPEPAAAPPVPAPPPAQEPPQVVPAPPPAIPTMVVAETIPLERSRPAAPPPVPAVQPERPNSVTIPRGTILHVRVLETLSSENNIPGDTFMVTLDEALVADGFVIAERGAHGEGRIVEAQKSKTAHGAFLSFELTQISTSDGQTIPIRTESQEREGSSAIKSDAAKIAIGAAAGSAIGGAAGGGKGAAIGAAAGGAAGAGAVLLSKGKSVVLPSESKVVFHLQEPVSLTEQLH